MSPFLMKGLDFTAATTRSYYLLENNIFSGSYYTQGVETFLEAHRYILVSKSDTDTRMDNEEKQFARIGLTFGLFNHYLLKMLNGARETLETGITHESG